MKLTGAQALIKSLEMEGVDVMFAPSVAEMYPDPPGTTPTTVAVPALSAHWEGASRPGHFDGVATVVVKLLSAAGRCRAYFGEKDFQQLALVARVVRDLALPTCVVGCPTVRDPDGLALMFAWLRFSQTRQLDWQRRYNTKPKELSHSQDRLTMRLAAIWKRNSTSGKR